jgi:hypothetical protein
VEKSLLYGEKRPYNSCVKNIFHFSKKYLDILYNFIDNTDMYYGGKSGYGVYHTIINQIPPHEVYIEPFLGGGGIMKHKRRAKRNIGVELDLCVIETWQQHEDIELHHTDALSFLKEFKFTGEEFIYADPPYLVETRSGRYRYHYELSQQDHIRLLSLLKEVPCKVMVSGYWSALYEKELSCFRVIQFRAMTRSGSCKTECLWMNYPEPTLLHDYRYVGSNFRERELITRKKKRLIERFKRMPKLERQAILASIHEFDFEKC